MTKTISSFKAPALFSKIMNAVACALRPGPGPQLMNTRLPGEPSGLSGNELLSVRSGILQTIPEIIAAETPHKPDSGHIFLSVSGSLLSLSAIIMSTKWVGIFGTVEFGHNASVFYAGIAGMILFSPVIAYQALLDNKLADSTELLDQMEKAKWYNIYMESIGELPSRTSVLPYEMSVLCAVIEKYQRENIRITALSMRDTVEMVRFSERLSIIREKSIVAGEVKLTGENSELLSRVVEEISGKSMNVMLLNYGKPLRFLPFSGTISV